MARLSRQRLLQGLAATPPGAHFSRISGLRDRVTSQTTGEWLEFDPEVVEAAIYEHAGHPDMEASERLRVDAVREFDTWKLTALSVIESAGSSDTFLTRLGVAVEELRILHSSDVINAHRPSGQLASLDMVAAGQGHWTPPHISLLARVHAVQYALGEVARLGEFARQAGSHLARRQRRAVPHLRARDAPLSKLRFARLAALPRAKEFHSLSP